MKTYQALSALLQYPQQALIDALPELTEAIHTEALLGRANRTGLDELCNWLGQSDVLELQSGYVDVFDRTPANSLHLFEHIYGDDRSRGQALADLADVYVQAGLDPQTNETPDYLPLFLEYLSQVTPAEAQASLASTVDVLATLRQRLAHRHSTYAMVFAALLELARLKPNAAKVRAALRLNDGHLPTAASLDTQWAETPAMQCPDTACQQECKQ